MIFLGGGRIYDRYFYKIFEKYFVDYEWDVRRIDVSDIFDLIYC
jgi:hypothetical protein